MCQQVNHSPPCDVSTPPQGSVPVVVTPGGRPLAGEALLLHLHDLSITEPCNTGAVCVFPLAEVGFIVVELQTNLCEDYVKFCTYYTIFCL